MKPALALSLRKKAEEVAERFSGPREKNFNLERFLLEDVAILSESSAAVCFRKNTGKLALAFFYHIDSRGGYWAYFFPSDNHILGMQSFKGFKDKVELNNFGLEIRKEAVENEKG